jgi:hypothetical protein
MQTCSVNGQRMNYPDYADYVEALRARFPEWIEDFAAFQGITGLLNWMQQRGLNQAAVDIVGQDEFHYDFLIQFDPGGRWLAFGVT